MKYFTYVFSNTLLLIFLPVLSFATTTTITADHTILVNNYSFTPAELTISPGESVAFINVEGLHNVNGISSTLSGEPFNNPEEFFLPEVEGTMEGVLMGEIIFEQPGVYNYDCSIGFHAQLGMLGTITVDGFTIKDLLETDLLPEVNLSRFAFLGNEELDSGNELTLFIPNEDAVDEVIELMNLSQFALIALEDMDLS